MIRLALLGATGRMGLRVADLLNDDPRFHLVAALTRRDDPRLGQSLQYRNQDLRFTESTDDPFDVLLDVAAPAATISWLEPCIQQSAAMVIGSTGHSPTQLAAIQAVANRIPVLKTGNFSLGVNLLLSLVADIANRLGDDYDIEIIEHHHNQKVDAPSGTAVSFLDTIIRATGRRPDADIIYGRQGHTGPRPKRQIGVHAVRMGDIVGHHEILFSAPGETISLRHTAASRDTFARGALHACAWLHGKPPGLLYSMTDTLDHPA